MKSKDLIYLCVAVVIFAIVGVVLFSQLSPKSSSGSGVAVEVVTPIQPQMDQKVLSRLTNPLQSRDFTAPLDLQHGLGNPQPFNPL